MVVGLYFAYSDIGLVRERNSTCFSHGGCLGAYRGVDFKLPKGRLPSFPFRLVRCTWSNIMDNPSCPISISPSPHLVCLWHGRALSHVFFVSLGSRWISLLEVGRSSTESAPWGKIEIHMTIRSNSERFASSRGVNLRYRYCTVNSVSTCSKQNERSVCRSRTSYLPNVFQR